MGACTDIQSKQLKNLESLSSKAKKELLRSSKSLKIPKGSVIFKENQPLNKLYCIKKGACKFSKIDNTGQEHILRFLGPGEVMGKRSLLTNNGAKVSATALSDIELCCLDKSEIQKNLNANPKFCQDFLDALVEDANINDYTRMIFCVNKGIKQRLASVLGTSPEYIINLLKSFKNFGHIDTVKSEIYVLSHTGLEKMAA